MHGGGAIKGLMVFVSPCSNDGVESISSASRPADVEIHHHQRDKRCPRLSSIKRGPGLPPSCCFFHLSIININIIIVSSAIS